MQIMRVDLWIRDNPKGVLEILDIARTMRPVRRNQVVMEYARRNNLPVYLGKRDRVEGDGVMDLKRIVTAVLDAHPEIVMRWSGVQNGRHDIIWNVVGE